ncbi:9588_t:CDS:2, partial [Funneliformis caledonium]
WWEWSSTFVEEKGNPEKTTIIFTNEYMETRLSGIAEGGKPNGSLKLHGDDLAAVVAKVKPNKSNKKIVLVGWSYGFDGFSTIVDAYTKFTDYRSAKPLSDELSSFMLGQTVLVSNEYRKNSVIDLSNFFSKPKHSNLKAQDRIIPLNDSCYASLSKYRGKIVYDCRHSTAWEVAKTFNWDISKFVSKE